MMGKHRKRSQMNSDKGNLQCTVAVVVAFFCSPTPFQAVHV